MILFNPTTFLLVARLFLLLLPSIQAVDVVMNLLSAEECEEYLNRPVTNLLPETIVDKFRYKTILDKEIATRLAETISFFSKTTPLSKECVNQAQEIYLSSIVRTTQLHQDRFVDSGKPLSDHDTKVGFVFLEDNQNAYFIHGDQRISVEKGKFVAFDGGVPHQTVLGSKTPVRLMGPFSINDKGFALVG
jgi:hypothetical protein